MENANERIKTGVERSVKALTLKPSLGRGTGHSTVTVKDGLTCEVVEGPWRFVVDMPTSVGGAEAGPTPGVYGRGALGSCLAIGYMMRAARLGIPIEALTVDVEADYDDGALFGTTDDVPPGYTQVRYTVTVESSAPEVDIVRMLDEADALSPYLDVFRRAQQCVRRIHVRATTGS
jgi:uncharacterized OsmC-like protein